ncbi:VanZ family protein [Leptothoe sp. PORK10 BA2]|uniref:VanZ family protein n=1 Tax=Leptothoe sp. PORK10 BA2 TaxID=3110254 RepID=UPI002B213F36|nr:VanZ family protein [Leptothoe sp. PORK10 BA2]MEA5466491.1 VanZ family protein [Leptothoe sp. PORK10 BA2]
MNGATLNSNNSSLEFQRPGIVTSVTPPQGLSQQLNAGKGLTIEAWLDAVPGNQFGPARIISYSPDPFHRNFVLGQHKNDLVFRLRTSETDLTAAPQEIVVPDVFTSKKRLHVVVSYDFFNCQIYINGQLKKQSGEITGDFSNWDTSYPLLLGNERTGDRPWLGRIEQLAFYQGPMSATEVVERYRAPVAATERPDAVTAFEFSDRADGLILDQGMMQPIVPLELPSVYTNADSPHFLSPKQRHIQDFITNFILFLPLGLLWFSVLFNSSSSAAKALATAGIIVLSYALTTEFLQHYVDGRSSAFFDLASCLVGGVVGSFIGWRSRFFNRGSLSPL